MAKRLSRNTFIMDKPPTIRSYAAVVGKKEGDGPLGRHFDQVYQDPYFGQDTWEKAESELLRLTVMKALEKGKLRCEDINYMFAGDLINQCTSTSYALRELEIPLLCVYGACSTMSESLLMASLMTDSDIGGNVVAVTSSHFCSAERQFRFPLSYGGVRTPTAQWTCTASGAAVVSPHSENGPYVKAATIGKIVDMGVTDANNMGAAMAPAAAYVIKTHLEDRGLAPDDFDLIITGDLGRVGGTLLIELLAKEGINISSGYKDCGTMIFDYETQDVHAGGSGCGCSASVLCGYFLDKVKSGELKNILFCATGALMSPTLSQQGESIPGISHAVHISYEG
ncbi:stage V sporulation protein AD [Huintestinicola butyrica]|jgi:stage V sporulation protein AD|uniref:stage V sporulation protein AD n=1 Tax=Huintestinicola butyrica TaxID=2981728 RepID=UPI003A4C2A1B|nr:stage V sporulation protein AD [Ruminococcus sp.]